MADINRGSTRSFTPSDATVDAFNEIMVATTAGTLAYEQEGGNTIALAAVPVGVWIPVGNAIRVKSTGTSAVGILVR